MKGGENVLLKTEKTTQMILGSMALALALVYIFVTLGKTQWVQWIAVIVGFLLFAILVSEGAVMDYFKRKQYRTVDFSDVVVWVTLGLAVGVFLNSLLLIGALQNSAPEWLVNFSRNTGVTVGVAAAALAVVHMVTPRFK